MHPYPHLRQTRYNKSFLSLVQTKSCRWASQREGPAQNKWCPWATLGQQQHRNAMGNRCDEKQAHGCVNGHPQKLSSLRDHPCQVSRCYAKGPCHRAEHPVRSQSQELRTPPFRKVCHPRILAFALLQDTVLHFKIPTLCQMLGRRVGNGRREQTFLLPCLAGVSEHKAWLKKYFVQATCNGLLKQAFIIASLHHTTLRQGRWRNHFPSLV